MQGCPVPLDFDSTTSSVPPDGPAPADSLCSAALAPHSAGAAVVLARVAAESDAMDCESASPLVEPDAVVLGVTAWAATGQTLARAVVATS